MKGFGFIWRRPGGLPECPYFRLTELKLFGYALAIHEWSGDDDHRAFHDHGQWFITLVLRGGYVDVRPDTRPGHGGKVEYDVLRCGSIRFRPATYQHKVTEVKPGTVTLLLKGRPSRRWGFFQDGRAWKRDKYFAEHGHHGCTPGAPAVRMRPDGSRIEEVTHGPA